MEDRRRRIIIIIVVILGFIRNEVNDADTLNWTMHNQLWQVFGITFAPSPSTSILKAADDLCTAIDTGTGDLGALSEALGNVLP